MSLYVVVTGSISTGSPTTSKIPVTSMTLTSSIPSPTPTAQNSKKPHGKSLYYNSYYFNYVN